jgi:hypothetical protein
MRCVGGGIAVAATFALAAMADPAAANVDGICDGIASAAEAHELPPEFLARLIWTESRFEPGAVSPKGAQGVAQFMPGTARLRGLADPFDPAKAILASAAYLAELRRRFGNLGLAAAAYNSGEDRVERWLKGETGLPAETRTYVAAITDHPADWLRDGGREVTPEPLAVGKPFIEGCRTLPMQRLRATPLNPWGVLVASNLDRAGALRAFDRIQKQHPAVLAGVTPTVSRNRQRRSAAQSWLVQVGADRRSAAQDLCASLRRRGGACVVIRN